MQSTFFIGAWDRQQKLAKLKLGELTGIHSTFQAGDVNKNFGAAFKCITGRVNGNLNGKH